METLVERPETSDTQLLVARLDDLPLGEVATVRTSGGVPISVFHTEEGLFAIDDTCTHQDASLSDGWVEDCTVECPLHDSCFDLRTGKVSGPPAKVPVRTYEVLVVEGDVFVLVP
ncbi:bifunctional 3-phenylpropionate/cinnamic acid dioxygenase ferredoxin subunit [Nocardia mexicana]|uniref:3-phenylpropionate/trans-cinnamate dioxygenase ferredoxin subunit/ethylbenzene dioxygenase ferredoxin subunit n=1 Tax=Nocardia mexicana TaxID=279262 RepID=A0A370HAB2_9NOCA|nr:bifunctional 3-phenylpropionate/cinnamic acid dioxygenase ferredoxin subunit [Nocardia mexicana]RDI53886.1 3-phenylpropionate/trans-cinnamate dioxygenase ferredoxin subunit/ethylbenzene dioxygenase ferredoxin subunit [Nocardia mexicana]